MKRDTGLDHCLGSMHICFVTETYWPEINGVAMTMQRLVEGMLERGHRVSLVRPRQQAYDRPGCCQDPQTMLVAGMVVPGYRGIHIGLPAGHKLLKCWQDDTPDVIYVATEGPLGWSALRAARRLGIPVLSGFHTNFHTYARHYRVGLLQHVILAYLRRFHNQTAGTLVPNKHLAETLTRAGLENVSILERGVDSQRFHPRHRCQQLRRGWGAGQDDPVYLYVGRVAKEKNIDLAIEAFRHAHRQNERARLVVVGDGPLYDSLQKANPDVIFCGMQTGKALARYYASADIFLFASETETFGNVTLEAMASGLVVVAYDYAAAQLHVESRVNGLLADLGDEAQFTACAIEALQHARPAEGMRENTRCYAETIGWHRIYDKFELLLGGCLPLPVGQVA